MTRTTTTSPSWAPKASLPPPRVPKRWGTEPAADGDAGAEVDGGAPTTSFHWIGPRPCAASSAAEKDVGEKAAVPCLLPPAAVHFLGREAAST
jgi:hypothetical protein